MLLPACVAVMVQMPEPPMCTVLPETVQVLGVEDAKLTGRFELAVALTWKSGAPTALSANAPKVIVWFAFAMTSVPLALPW